MPVRISTEERGDRALARLGAKPIINACGIYTDLGGSRLSPNVWAAMTAANDHFVEMVDLLETSGRILASHLGAEAGRVTPGAAASITLMVSAAMTGADGAAGQRLPESAGLRNEVVIQRKHHYKYDRQISMTGARLIWAGDDRGTTPAQLEAVIGPRTAALFVPAHLDGAGGAVPLAEVVSLGHRRGIPTLVDAAYLCWPLETLPTIVRTRADLVCVSAKYFGGPNAGGFIVGSRAMIDSVVVNDFTRYESGPFRTFGRPLKMDRQTVIGVVAAFEEWLALDHDARWRRYRQWVDQLIRRLDGAPGVTAHGGCFTMDERIVPEPVNALVVEFGVGSLGRAATVAAILAAHDPPVLCVTEPTRLIFCLDVVNDREVSLIGDVLAGALSP